MLKGFDISAFPGVPLMKSMRNYFDFTGFYLGGAPSHPDLSWMQRKSDLRAMGFMFMPIYVGQQILGPGSHNDSPDQGAKDGVQACDLMAQAGFAKGSPCYLDLENGAPFPPAEGNYANAWLDAVSAGAYRPGVYCSHVLAPHFNPDHTLVWAFEVPTTRRMATTLPMNTSWAPPRVIPWHGIQYRQNVYLPQLKLTVDLDATPNDTSLAN